MTASSFSKGGFAARVGLCGSLVQHRKTAAQNAFDL
jgi:hypothetical protein